MWVTAALFVIGYGEFAPLVPAVMVDWDGKEQLSTVTEIGLMGFFVGSAIGPWLTGFVFDVSGSYLWDLLLSEGISIAGVIIARYMMQRPLTCFAKSKIILIFCLDYVL